MENTIRSAERNEDMKKIFIFALITIVLCFCAGNTCADDARAREPYYKNAVMAGKRTSKSTMAKRAYAKVLSNEKKASGVVDTSWGLGANTKFALIDINRDKIPELIFTSDDGYHVSIAAYIKGRAKSVGGGFSGYQKYYPKKHIYFSQTTHTGDDVYTYYRFTGKKMKAIAEKYGNDTYNAVTGKKKTKSELGKFTPYRYTVNGKIVSKKKYNAYVRKVLSGAKSVSPKWHRNTKRNRKRYLMK